MYSQLYSQFNFYATTHSWAAQNYVALMPPELIFWPHMVLYNSHKCNPLSGGAGLSLQFLTCGSAHYQCHQVSWHCSVSAGNRREGGDSRTNKENRQQTYGCKEAIWKALLIYCILCRILDAPSSKQTHSSTGGIPSGKGINVSLLRER